MNIRHATAEHRGTPKLQRMFKHIFNELRAAGTSEADAIREAAATVNKYRAKLGITVEELGRSAARKRGWWPGWKRIR